MGLDLISVVSTLMSETQLMQCMLVRRALCDKIFRHKNVSHRQANLYHQYLIFLVEIQSSCQSWTHLEKLLLCSEGCDAYYLNHRITGKNVRFLFILLSTFHHIVIHHYYTHYASKPSPESVDESPESVVSRQKESQKIG